MVKQSVYQDTENIQYLCSSETTFNIEEYASTPQRQNQWWEKARYKTPYKSYEHVYVEETGRPLGTEE